MNGSQRKRKPHIPERNRDLHALVRRRALTRIALYLVWLAALTVGVLRYQAWHTLRPMKPWQTALWLCGGAVVGCFLFRVQSLFTNRTTVGRITRSGISHGVKGDDFRINTVLRITDEQSGKRRRLRFEQKNGFYALYQAGTRVCKFPLLPYPLPDPETLSPIGEREEKADGKTNSKTDQGGTLCVVCGLVSGADPTADRCPACRHTLLNPEDVFDQTK